MEIVETGAEITETRRRFQGLNLSIPVSALGFWLVS
jgi:hypothetical protein